MSAKTPISFFAFILLIAILTTTATGYPLTITDDFGCTITTPHKPERIVSLAPSNTEILFAVGAGRQVVGVTTYDDYPPDVANISKIGGFSTVNIEAVVNLTPDLVLASYGNGEDTVNSLRKLNLTVVTLHPKNLTDILKNIRLIANITGHRKQGDALVANMTQQINVVTDKTSKIPENLKPKVLYVIWNEPMYAAGSGTYPDDIIQKAGGINIVNSTGWPVVSLESVVEQDPDIIICSRMGGSHDLKEWIMNNPVLQQTSAVKNKRVYPLADPNIAERAGPRITQGLLEIHNYIEEYIESETSDVPSSPVNTTPAASHLLTAVLLLTAYLTRKRAK